MKKLLLLFLSMILLICFGCHTYYIQSFKPNSSCTEINATDTIKRAISNGFYYQINSINDTAIYIPNNEINFSKIKNMRLGQKKKLSGHKYYLEMFTSSGWHAKRIILTTKNKQQAENVFLAIECLCNIDPKTDQRISGHPDKYDELKKINELYKSGAITKEEYEKEKKKIMK